MADPLDDHGSFENMTLLWRHMMSSADAVDLKGNSFALNLCSNYSCCKSLNYILRVKKKSPLPSPVPEDVQKAQSE